MASRELAEAELVGTIAETKDVAVGVIDVKSYYVETPEDVARRVRRFVAARAAGAARVLDRLRPQPDGALGGAAEAREPRRRRADRARRARVIEPLLADDAFLADVERPAPTGCTSGGSARAASCSSATAGTCSSTPTSRTR